MGNEVSVEEAFETYKNLRENNSSIKSKGLKEILDEDLSLTTKRTYEEMESTRELWKAMDNRQKRKENTKWISKDIKPKRNTWIIVKDKNGEEYRNHQWTGQAWYRFIRDEDSCDGWKSDIDIVSWKYQED